MQKVFRIERGPTTPRGGRPADGPGATSGTAMGARTRMAIRAALVAGTGLRRAAVELQAVVSDTARAAHAILAAVEEIDAATDRLRVAQGRSPAADTLDDISERCVMILQACDFQDLTGQRIDNVVGLFSDLETRLAEVRALVDENDGADEAVFAPRRTNAGELENGPRLQSDSGHLTQGQIDVMFEELGEGF